MYFCDNMRLLLFFIISLSVLSFRVSAQDNPFTNMIGKSYAEYGEELNKSVYKNIDLRDSTWLTQTIAQMYEVAHLSGERRWELEASMVEADWRFFRVLHLRRLTQQEVESLAEEMIVTLSSIVKQAEKRGAIDIKIRALHSIMHRYAYVIRNYEMAFRYCYELDKAMSSLSTEEFPLKPVYYTQIALQYMYFQEYETARLFLEKVLENPDIAYRGRVLEATWNDLGLIYRNHYNDLVASDSCFNHIFDLKPTNIGQNSSVTDQELHSLLQREYELWSAIATGNLGHNAYLKGEYGEAIPLLEYGMERVVKNNPYNYPYAAGKALILAEIFLEKSDLLQVKRYADRAYDFLDKEQKRYNIEEILRNANLWGQYYNVMSSYMRMRGDYSGALLYADSTLTTRELFENDFSLRKLHRAEQRIKQEELDAERVRIKSYRRSILLITAFLSIILFLLGMLYYHYRKKRSAYHELVQRNKQWAESDLLEKDLPGENSVIVEDNVYRQKPTKKDIELTNRIHRMIVDGLYRDSSLTLDSLARLLGVNRETVSRSINRTTGKNFTRFLNEYRIKESIRLISARRNYAINFDDLSEQVGFNNRSTFYRAFKQITGLPPGEFKNNS